MLNSFFIEEHVKRALEEDIGFGDITTDCLVDDDTIIEAKMKEIIERNEDFRREEISKEEEISPPNIKTTLFFLISLKTSLFNIFDIIFETFIKVLINSHNATDYLARCISWAEGYAGYEISYNERINL